MSQQLSYRIQEDGHVVAHVSARTSAAKDYASAVDDKELQRAQVQQTQVPVADDVHLACIVQNYNSHSG